MFQFVFQRGEFYNESQAIGGGHLTIAMSILLFVFKRSYDSWKNRRDEKRRLKNTRFYYLSLLNEITDPIERQANAIEKFAVTQLSGVRVMRFNLDNITSLNTDEIMSVNSQDLFKSMITHGNKDENRRKDDIHHYGRLKSHVRLVGALKKEFEVEFKQLIAHSNIHLTEFQRHIMEIERARIQFPSSGSTELASINFITQLNLLQKKSNETNVDGEDLEIIQNDYLKVLISLCYDYLQKSRIAADILLHAMVCDSHINDLRKITKQYQVEFGSTARKLRQSSRQITESVAYFQSVPHTKL